MAPHLHRGRAMQSKRKRPNSLLVPFWPRIETLEAIRRWTDISPNFLIKIIPFFVHSGGEEYMQCHKATAPWHILHLSQGKFTLSGEKCTINFKIIWFFKLKFSHFQDNKFSLSITYVNYHYNESLDRINTYECDDTNQITILNKYIFIPIMFKRKKTKRKNNLYPEKERKDHVELFNTWKRTYLPARDGEPNDPTSPHFSTTLLFYHKSPRRDAPHLIKYNMTKSLNQRSLVRLKVGF